MGHLGGRAEKHFTIEACPKYHNKTAQECKVSVSYHYVLATHDPVMSQGKHSIRLSVKAKMQSLK
jgi:hypothetical protein